MLTASRYWGDCLGILNLMKQGDAIELLNSMNDREAIIFIYRFVFGVHGQEVARCRKIQKKVYNKHLESVIDICTRTECHQEAIASIRQSFGAYKLDDFSVLKVPTEREDEDGIMRPVYYYEDYCRGLSQKDGKTDVLE